MEKLALEYYNNSYRLYDPVMRYSFIAQDRSAKSFIAGYTAALQNKAKCDKCELAEDAIEALEELIDNFYSEITEAYYFSLEDKTLETLKNTLIDYQKWIEDGDKAKWIKCSDRLPERGVRVLAWDNYNIRLLPTDVAIQVLPSDVTHWQPLPQNP